ncbi:MAG TPA: hypothetical protein VD993_11620 [Chitinophagaceae bacterium]|nr:hypothetical protein [Chitinophagaceae bacterium]
MSAIMSAIPQALQSFADASMAMFEQGKIRALALPANTVQVWPGGATFTTIQAAINSITNASPQVEYQVAVGPGTYNETVTMIDYIYITGAGSDQTTITANATGSPFNGVVNSSSNSGISEVTIKAVGTNWGDWPCGIKIMGAGEFHISGVNIITTDNNVAGCNVRGISNNTGSYTANIIFGQSTLQASGVQESTAVGIELFGMSGATIFCNLSAIQVTGATQTFGVSTAVNATATLTDCKIIASTWALYNSDGSAQITANQCTIDGPVSSGVVVNN